MTEQEQAVIDLESIKTGMVLDTTSTAKLDSRELGRVLPEVTVFEHRDFQGDNWRTTFGYSFVGSHWNDRISSIIVHSGYFEFYEHRDFAAEHWGPIRLGPGQYAFVGDVGITNDSISSWKAYFGS